jgi:hypothetical protein
VQVLEYFEVDVIYEDDKHSNLQVSINEIFTKFIGIGSFNVGSCRLYSKQAKPCY